jgi:hypothetical protein
MCDPQDNQFMQATRQDRSWLMTYHQKAVVMKLLADKGAPTNEFSWRETTSTISSNNGLPVSELRHKVNGHIACIFDRSGSDVLLLFSPAAYVRYGKIEFKWQYLDTYIAPWAEFAARELKAADYLKSVMSIPEFTQIPLSDHDSTKFDQSEKELLHIDLEKIETYLVTLHSDVVGYAEDVRKHFQFLELQLERSDRRAFYYCVFGTLATIGTTYLGTDGTRDLLRFAAEQLNSVIQLLSPSPI